MISIFIKCEILPTCWLPQLRSAQFSSAFASLWKFVSREHRFSYAHTASEPKPKRTKAHSPTAPCVMCCRLENMFFSLSCLPTVRAIGLNKVHTQFQRKKIAVSILSERGREGENTKQRARNLTKIYKTRSETIKTTQFIENRRPRPRLQQRIMSICV